MPFTTIFFDLDDTLYPASSGLWQTLKERMSRYMIERLHIPAEDVPRLRERYFREYGTTLRGLQASYAVDMQDYLAYVHDVRLEDYIHPDPRQQAVLASLRTRNLILTNADVHHARRVLRHLHLEEYFADIIDIHRMEPYCKPHRAAFARAMQIAGESDPSRCALIDDLLPITRAAKAFGWYAILYREATPALPPPSEAEADAVMNYWDQLPALLNGRRA